MHPPDGGRTSSPEKAQGITQGKEKEDAARYIQGYLEDPETPEEMASVLGTRHYAFDDDSWEQEFNR